jgi:hypothetical protein
MRYLLFLALLLGGSFLPSRASADDKNAQFFAFVALREVTVPTADEVQKALKAALPLYAKADDIQVDTEKKTVTFKINGDLVVIGILGDPIPWKDLEKPCADSLFWKEAAEQLKQQKAHLLVSYLGDKGPQTQRCILLTKMLAACTKIFPSIGVYWSNGGVVLSNELIQQEADSATPDNLPLTAWISFHVKKNADNTLNVSTAGLAYFGCMEIEDVKSKKMPEEILNTVMGVAALELSGEKVKDGDTIGPDDATKIKTHYAKSSTDKHREVLRVDF